MTTPGSTSISFPSHLSDLSRASLTVAARTSFLEGPAVARDGQLYFSDLIGNRIYRMTPAGELHIFRADSGRANGNTFDAQGRLVTCEGAEQGPGGRRRVVRPSSTPVPSKCSPTLSRQAIQQSQ